MWRLGTITAEIPDFAQHVARVQAMGLKYLLWFSVPYIGKNTKAWERFHDKLLRYNESQQAGIFDLRYPEVREYLKAIYVKAVKDWNLDGLKLDFIDEFYFRKKVLPIMSKWIVMIYRMR